VKGIPPEIDTLLWAVAEDESPRAGDEFVARYPKYAGELARRRQMVQGLKGGRPTKAATVRTRPAFRPAPVRTQPVSRRTAVGVGALLLAAIAVASYTIATVATPPAKEDPAPTIVQRETPPVKEPEIRYEVPPVQNNANPDVPSTPRPEDPSHSGPPRAERGQDFKVKGADLAGALAMLGAEAGVQIIVAPGMGKRVIDADYENMPLPQILKDMGERYGFTAFDQGDGSIIVVPATESAGGRMPDKKVSEFRENSGEPKPR
jgi:hypothetical protein